MNLIVKYNELKDIGTFIEEKVNEIEESLGNINNIVVDISSAWKGDDSDKLSSKLGETVENELERLDKLSIVSEAIKYAAISYKAKDEDWVQQVKRGEINQ